jgi:hypothetical protein
MEINYNSTEIKNEIIKCLKEKIKFSLLRMGDGEMILANNVEDKIIYFSEKQIGRQLTKSELLVVQRDMIESVLSSTVLGLPTNKHIIQNSLWEDLFLYYDNIKMNNPKSKNSSGRWIFRGVTLVALGLILYTWFQPEAWQRMARAG